MPPEEKTLPQREEVGSEQHIGVEGVEDLPSTAVPTPRHEERPVSRAGMNWFNTALIAFLVLSLGFSVFTYVDSSNRVNYLSGQVASLTSTVQALDTSLAESNFKIASLSIALNSSSGGSSGGVSEISSIYERVRGSVVLIKVTLPSGTATGSGFVYDVEGRIITNNHVIDGAKSITVTFINGTIVPATVVGADPYSDIAVIDVDAPAALLVPLKLGDSSALVVGESVLAIGNPYSLADTLTTGIISALGREMDSESGSAIVDVIQTDAAINPGNSGGPLLNMGGEVVGINTAIASSTSTGIGFAVPSNTIAREIADLITKGSYAQIYLGVSGLDVTPGIIFVMGLPEGTYGTLITTVGRGSPAEKAGLRGGSTWRVVDGSYVPIGGDVVTAVDGQRIKSLYDLILYMQRTKRPGDLVSLTIIRGGSTMLVDVTLGTRTS